jgi:hypothetical protein
MIVPLLLIVGGAYAGFRLSRSLDAASAPKAPTTPKTGARPSGAGELQRVSLRVPLGHVEAVRRAHGAAGQKALLANVGQRLLRLGYGEVLAVVEDPTDAEAFTAIARRTNDAFLLTLPARSDAVVRIVRTDSVEEPPRLPRESGILDPGLSQEELFTIRSALASDEDPRHLSGLATTLEPFYPIAASLLRAKAMLVETRNGMNAQRLAHANQAAATSIARTAEGQAPGMGASVLEWMRGREDGVGALQSVTQRETKGRWPEVQAMWAAFAPYTPRTWYGWDRMRVLLRGKDTPRTDAQLRANLGACARRTNMPLEVIEDEVRRAACLMIEEPQNLFEDGRTPTMDPLRRIQIAQFPPEVQEAARRIVREVGLGLWIVDPERLRAILPPNGREGFVSPSALQLSLAAGKPEIAGVQDRQKARAILQDLNADRGADRQRLLKAQAQMERANRAIERRRWIDWYQRRARAGL